MGETPGFEHPPVARSRHRRWLLRITAIGVVAVVALVVVQLTTGAPRRLAGQVWPGPKDAATYKHSTLYGQPLRGSLASDHGWVNGLMDWLNGKQPYRSGLLAGHTLQRGKLRVLYAGDVGPYRAALVEGVWAPPGGEPRSMQVWLSGPAGAKAGQLVAHQRVVPVQDSAIGLLGHWSTDPAATGPATLPVSLPAAQYPARVVVTRYRMTVKELYRVQLAGTGTALNGELSTGVNQNGAFEVALDARYALLVVGGRLIATSGTYVPAVAPGITVGQTHPLRGGGTWPLADGAWPRPPALLSDFRTRLSDAVLSPRDQGRFTLLASAPPVDGSGQTGRSLVGMITYTTGARELASLGVAPDGTQWLMAGSITPQGSDLRRLSFAWVQPDGLSGSTVTSGVPGWSGAVGPDGTATVEWTHAGGARTTSRAVNATATTRSTDVTGVRFLDAGGHGLGTARVSPPLVPTVAGPLLQPMISLLAGM